MKRLAIQRKRPLAATIVAAALLSGCNIVDRFGPRVDTYNDTAGASKGRLLLQNIIRSAYQEPLQWSTVSQILGTASITASVSGKVPIIGHRATSSLFYEVDPSAGLSGGPTFTVPLLDTKEFQGGIQNPVSLQTLRSYLDQGYSLNILLPLLVSAIEVGPDKDHTATIENFDVDRPEADATHSQNLINLINLFDGSLHVLVDQGLTIEQRPAPVGALLVSKDFTTPKTITDATTAGFVVQRYETSRPSMDPYLTTADKAYLKGQKANIYFRTLQTGQYRFCFDSARRYHEQNLAENVLVRSSYTGAPFTLLVKQDNTPDKRTSMRVTPDLVCGYKGPAHGNGEVLNLTLRSVEGAVRYLGAVTKLEIDSPAPQWSGPQVAFSQYDDQTFTLFHVYRSSPPGSSIDVLREGKTYSISLDNYPHDASGKVVSLLLELVNLNNSVKDQPTPNVISVAAP